MFIYFNYLINKRFQVHNYQIIVIEILLIKHTVVITVDNKRLIHFNLDCWRMELNSRIHDITITTQTV